MSGQTINDLTYIILAGSISSADDILFGASDVSGPEQSGKMPFTEVLSYAAGLGLKSDDQGLALDVDTLPGYGTPDRALDYLCMARPGQTPEKVLIDNILDLGDNTDLGLGTVTSTIVPLTSSTGSGVNLPLATSLLAGTMSASDKDRLDNMADDANNYVHPDHTGDVTSLADGATTISALAVATGMIQDDAVTNDKIGPLAVGTTEIAALAVTTAQLALVSVDATILADNAVETAKIVDANVTLAKLAADAITDLAIVETSGTSLTIEATQTGSGAKAFPAASGSVMGALTASDWTRFDSVALNSITPEAYGAVGDGVANDTAAFNSAVAAAGSGVLRLPNKYRIVGVSGILLGSPGLTIIGEGWDKSQIICDEDWTNDPAVEVFSDNITLRDFAILETNASPINTAKSGSQNIGLKFSAANGRADNIKVSGFGYGMVFGRASDATRDNNVAVDCDVSNAYSWGIEVDSAKKIQLTRVDTHGNGLDGLKCQNTNSRTCEGLVLTRCDSYDNGLRNTAAGGGESTTGEGFDLFSGGFAFKMIACRGYANYGSGLIMQGTSPQPEQGHGTVVGCDFDDNLSTSEGTSHGIEIGRNFSTTTSWTSFSGCMTRGNTGHGVLQEGGTGVSFVQHKSLANGEDGYCIRRQAFKTTIANSMSLGNTGTHGISFGDTNDDTLVYRGHVLRDSVISGQYDPNVGDGNDIEAAATNLVTLYGIRIWSDSRGIDILNTKIVAVKQYSILNGGDDVYIDGCDISEITNYGVYNWTNALKIKVVRSKFRNMMHAVGYQTGNGTEPALGTTVTGSITGATGTLVHLQIDSGTFAGGTATGIAYLSQTTGAFNAATDSLNYTGGATSTCDSFIEPYAIRVLNGTATVEDCEFTVQAARTDDPNVIYVDDVATNFFHKGNSQTNLPRLIYIEPTTFIKNQDLIVNDWGLVGDGVTDDGPAINRALAAAKNLEIGNIVFRPGRYATGENLILPRYDTGPLYYTRKAKIIGYGARLSTLANNLTILDGSIPDAAGHTTTVMVPSIEGFTLQGQAAESTTAGTGLRLDGAHCAAFKDIDFNNLAVGLQAIWCMQGLAESCHAFGCLNPFWITNGASGRLSDGTGTNSNSNVFRIANSRASLNDATAVGIKADNVSNLKIHNTTVEGASGLTGIDITMREGSAITSRMLEIDKLWCETTLLDTVIKFDALGCTLNLSQIMKATRGLGPSANETRLIDDTGSQQSVINLRDTMLLNWDVTTQPYFKNQSRAAGIQNAWRIEGVTLNAADSRAMNDPYFWDNDPATSILLSGYHYQNGVGIVTL